MAVVAAFGSHLVQSRPASQPTASQPAHNPCSSLNHSHGALLFLWGSHTCALNLFYVYLPLPADEVDAAVHQALLEATGAPQPQQVGSTLCRVFFLVIAKLLD